MAKPGAGGLRKRVPLLLAAVAIASSILALLVAELRVGQALERRMYDSWFRLRGPLERPTDVVIVAIDTDSEQAIGRYPWTRDWHAKLIRNLHRAGARVVAFDATFADAFPQHDPDLRAAIDESGGRVVLGAKTNSLVSTSATRLELEDPAPVFAGVPIGLVDTQPDAVDGVIREYPMMEVYPGERIVAQLGIQALLEYLELPADSFRAVQDGWVFAGRHIPRGPSGGMLVNYAGLPGYFSYYSYVTVVDDEETDLGEYDLDSFGDYLAEDRFKDKIVLVGSTVPEHQDLHPTPFRDAGDATEAMQRPGVEIHANAITTILSGRHIINIPRRIQYLWTALLGLLVVLAVPKVRIVGGAAVAVGLVAAAIGMAYYFFAQQGLWLWSVAPTLSIGLSYAGAAGVLYLSEEQEKAFIRGMFQQYVSSSVVNQLIEHPELLALGGEERVATVMFSDIVGFSSVSEQLTPTELVALLNEYLTEMTDIVLEHGGIIDKYQGDAIMAEFGVPVPTADHSVAACRAAVRMTRELAKMRLSWAEQGKPELDARIGINTGQMLVGNLGSRRVMDYTVMGDNVNLASRLEGANRMYGTTILVGEGTWQEVKGDFIGREIDRTRVKGKEQPISVHEVIATREEGVSRETRHLIEGYEAALALYRARSFADALAAFDLLMQKYPNDGPTRLLAKRCREYITNPPPGLWDGVYVMTVK